MISRARASCSRDARSSPFEAPRPRSPARSTRSATAGAEAVPLLAARGVSSGRVSTTGVRAAARRAPVGARGRAAGRRRLPLPARLDGGGRARTTPRATSRSRCARSSGRGVPVAMTCDLHGNVTRRMVENLDVLVGYRHYPHDDTRDTGRRAAELLLRAVAGEVRPVIAHAKLPLILTAFNSTTLDRHAVRAAPARGRRARGARRHPLRVGLPGRLVHRRARHGLQRRRRGRRRRGLAAAEAERLARRFWDEPRILRGRDRVGRRGRRGGDARSTAAPCSCSTPRTPPAAARRETASGSCAACSRPASSEPCLAQVVDPAAAAACHEAGDGAEVDLTVGHWRDPRWGRPLRAACDRPAAARRSVPLRRRHPRRRRGLDGAVRRGRRPARSRFS